MPASRTPARPEILHSNNLPSAPPSSAGGLHAKRGAPFEGTGKPEPLRRNLSGFWSRRIDHEHRLVHGATDDELIIIQARYHYDG